MIRQCNINIRIIFLTATMQWLFFYRNKWVGGTLVKIIFLLVNKASYK